MAMISVIMPTFHRHELLQQALASVQAQSYQHWEVVVVDDGDGQGAAIARSLGDPRIIGVTNAGRGQVDARNTALALARGELIALLDDDDAWAPVHLAQVAQALAAGPALCYSHGVMLLEQDGQWLEHPYTLSATPESLRRDNTLLTSSLAYPKALHRELGLFDRSMGSYFDWDWILRVLDAGYPLRLLEAPGVIYRVHGQGVSANPFSAARQAAFRRFCAKHQLDIEQKNHLMLVQERS